MKPMRQCRRKKVGSICVFVETLKQMKNHFGIVKVGKPFYKMTNGKVFFNKAKADAYVLASGVEYLALVLIKVLVSYGDE